MSNNFNNSNTGWRNNTSFDSEATNPSKIVLLSVPLEFDMDGIRNLCTPYGNIVDLRYKKSDMSQMFFVDFSKPSEAAVAFTKIKSLRNGMRVEYSNKPNKPSGNNSNQESNQSFKQSFDKINERESDHSFRPRDQPNKSYNTHTNNMYSNPPPQIDDSRNRYQPKGFNNNKDSRNSFSDTSKFKMNEQTTFIQKYPKQQDHQNQPQNKHQNNKEKSEYDQNDKAFTAQTINYKKDPSKKGYCIGCGKECVYICSRCKAFYCSKECQENDWPYHRSICNEMPELTTVPGSTTTVPGSSTTVPGSSTKSETTKNTETKGFSPVDRIERTKVQNNIHHNTSNQNYPNQNNRISKPNVTNETVKMRQPVQKESAMVVPVKEIAPKPAYKPNQISENIKTLSTELKQEKRVEPKPVPVLKGEFPPNKSLVSITAVISAQTVYIRSLETKANRDYCLLLQDILSFSDNAKQVTVIPQKGDILLAEYMETYNRALVLNAEDRNHIHVAYVDFGNTAVKKIDDLRELKEELQTLPRYSFKINLKNIKINSMQLDAKEYLTQLCLDVIELQLKYDDVTFTKNTVCELFETESNVSVNNKVNMLLAVNPPTADDPIIMIQDVKYRCIPKGKNVEVTVTDNSFIGSGLVSLSTTEFMYEFEQLSERINDYCKLLPEQPYTPRLNEACLAATEDQNWYRCICIETKGDGKPILLFLDIGNIAPILIKWIRRFPKEFCKIPYCASTCLVKDVTDELTAAQLNFLNKVFKLKKTVLLDEVEVVRNEEEDNEENLIYLKDVSQQFLEKN